MRDRRTIIRYILFQLPGSVILIGLLSIAIGVYSVSHSVAAAILLAWWIKDVALYPLTWRAYQPGDPAGDSRLLGREAVTLTDLRPDGKVRLGPEIWNARTDQAEPIPAGTPVVVKGTSGLTLIVSPY